MRDERSDKRKTFSLERSEEWGVEKTYSAIPNDTNDTNAPKKLAPRWGSEFRKRKTGNGKRKTNLIKQKTIYRFYI